MSDRFSALALQIDEPARMIVMHPHTGRPLRAADGRESYIDLLPRDSTKAQAFDRRLLDQRLARAGRIKPKSEDLEAELTDRLAMLTTGWLLVGFDGGIIDVEMTEQNARELYAAPRMLWLREAILAWLDDRANFTKAASTN